MKNYIEKESYIFDELEEMGRDGKINLEDVLELRRYADAGLGMDVRDFVISGGATSGEAESADEFMAEMIERYGLQSIEDEIESAECYDEENWPFEDDYEENDDYVDAIVDYIDSRDKIIESNAYLIAKTWLEKIEHDMNAFYLMHDTGTDVFTEEFDSAEDASAEGEELWKRLSDSEKKRSHVMVYQTENRGTIDEEMTTDPAWFDSENYSPIVLLEDDGDLPYSEDDEEWEAIELLKAWIGCDEVEERLLENVVREFVRRKGYDDHKEIVKDEIAKYWRKYGRHGSGKEVTWH